MYKIKRIYHFLFWFFGFLFVFDGMEYYFEPLDAVLYTCLELSIYALIFYTNLNFLIPKIFVPKGKIGYALGVLLFLLIIYMPYYYFEIGYLLMADSELRIFFSFIIHFILFIVLSYLFWYLVQYRTEQKRRLELENEKLKAELLLLKSHVSPHFLFNTLNNIYSLILSSNENASLMVEKLSDFLRYMIYEGEKERVPLEEEAKLIRSYFELQQLKKLKADPHLQLTIEGIQPNHKIAPLILINLVENCFKHSDVAFNATGFLHVVLKVNENVLYFKTSNSFLKNEKKPGIGMTNTKEQLKHNYPEKYEFQEEVNEGVFEVNLKIEL